jgi:hypothetical protein
MAKYGQTTSKYATFLYGTGGVITQFQKRYIYKIYDGDSLVAVWSADVISQPSFITNINGGAGELKISLARNFENFGEGVDVKLNNKVDVIVYDRDSSEGILLYRGFISAYAPKLIEGQETVDVTVLPYFAQTSYFMLRYGGNITTITYETADPGSMLQDIINKFQADGGEIETVGGSIDLTGQSIDYTLNTSTVREAIDKVVGLAPANWFWKVDPDNTIYFQMASQSVADIDHDLSIGEHFIEMVSERRNENVVNRVYVVGGDTGGGVPLYEVYERAGSIALYGLHAIKIVNQGITTSAAALAAASKILDENDEPETRLRLRISDNNGIVNNHGYDIESIQVGETIRVKNLNYGQQTSSIWDEALWDNGVWDYSLASVAGSPLTIVSTKYTPNYLEVVTSSRVPPISQKVQGVDSSLKDTQTKDNPSSPS